MDWIGPTGSTSRRTGIARTARRHDARRIRQRSAGRKSLWLGRIGRQREVRRRLSRRCRQGLERQRRLLRQTRPGEHRRRRVHQRGRRRHQRPTSTSIRTRRYATGISNGGMLAYALACNTGTFAAIGPDSATQLDKCAAPHPTSVMHIHGTADRSRPRRPADPRSAVRNVFCRRRRTGTSVASSEWPHASPRTALGRRCGRAAHRSARRGAGYYSCCATVGKM